jgi:hypothetical protein
MKSLLLIELVGDQTTIHHSFSFRIFFESGYSSNQDILRIRIFFENIFSKKESIVWRFDISHREMKIIRKLLKVEMTSARSGI